MKRRIQTTHRITDAPGGLSLVHGYGVCHKRGSVLQLVILNGFYEREGGFSLTVA
jgi:hypothetical protein